MKYIAKSKCQVDGHIYQAGDIVETDDPSPRMLEAFAKAPENALVPDDLDKGRLVAGMTRDDYRGKLDQMGIRYKKSAKAEELLQILVEAGRHPMAEVDALRVVKDAAKDADPKVKPNGGQVTSIGISAAKSLRTVKGNMNVLDIITRQVLALRSGTGYEVLLMFMNSYNTEADTLNYLEKYPDLSRQKLPISFLQNKFPRILQDNLKPYENEDPDKMWNPPGHGDIFAALSSSGLLDKMIDAGYRYAFTVNWGTLKVPLEMNANPYELPRYMLVRGNWKNVFALMDRKAGRPGGKPSASSKRQLVLDR